MVTSYSLKQKSANYNDASLQKCLEGTSARTRPLSFDDIMLRRKNRVGAAKQVPDGPGVSDIASVGENVNAHRSWESDRKMNDDSVHTDSRHISNDSQKLSFRRKRGASPSKNEKLILDRDKRSWHPEASSKVIADKNLRSDRFSSSKNERHHHRNRNKDGIHSDDIDYGSDMRQSRDLVQKDMVSERPRVKSKIIREQFHNGDEHLHRKRKTDDRISIVPEDRSEKRKATEVRRTDGLSDRRKDKSETEKKHKRHNDEDKTKRGSAGKQHDSEKQEKDSKQTLVEESRSKRRRSRSAECDKERARKSPSHSPKAHKHTYKDKREHGELSSHSTKDRAGIKHSDVDKKKISNNGSNSYRRNTGSSTGLGGYSPRKRKSDTAAKTPSPTRRSPERRNAGWDLPPVGKESIIASSTLYNPHISNLNITPDIKELPSGTPITQPLVKPVGISYHALPSKIHAIESVQLTQATRPMRRLYAENIPASASEKDLMECINKFFLSCRVSYIQGTKPCISCIIHKEKGQALLEFLTPEDASAALSFDGMFFSGSNLKLRRPKDYTDVTTGLDSDKSVVAVVDTVSHIVEDSPHKIFIGGISKLISSQMLLEIARAFGPVRAYHFEFTADSNEHCAFLEYVDHSVTSRSCAGLNGMRLGGPIITASLATPNTVLVETVEKPPYYGIPTHVKPLLVKPTTVLMLKNVLDPEGFLSFSESELEEILEDIRLECSRYGTVKSINVAKPINSIRSTEAREIKDTNASAECNDDKRYVTEQLGGSVGELGEQDRSEPSETLTQSENNTSKTKEDKNSSNTDSLSLNLVKDENSSAKDSSSHENGGCLTEELTIQQSNSVNESETNVNSAESVPVRNIEMENIKALIIEKEVKLEETNEDTGNAAELDHDERTSASEESDKKEIAIDFEPASVFVEYRSAEAACTAAHCLNGRVFDGRVVTVGDIDPDIYHMKFRK